MEDQKSQGVQGPRYKQTAGEPDQSQQPPVQPIFARGYDISPRTSRQTLLSLRPESPRSRHPEGRSKPPTEGQETSNRTKLASAAIAQSMLTDLVKCPPHTRAGSEVGSTPARPTGGWHIRRQDADDNDQREVRENSASDWRTEWAMDTFLKALEKVYAVEPRTASWKPPPSGNPSV